ncbi:MAG: OmpH family outer membrane protein [Candidatus Cryptobacteroides sp.]
MKKTAIILSICSLLVAIAALVLTIVPCTKKAECTASEEQTSGRGEAEGIAYFNLDEVISAYQFAIDLQQAFEKKAGGINDDITRRRTKIENEDKELADKLNKGLITRSVAEVKYNDLQNRIAEFQQYGQQKQNELAEEQQVILNNIANAVMEYVAKYNASHNYSLILSTQGNLLSQPVVTASESLNITAELIEGLNAEYQANKSKK